jgi:hypothetical protein
MLKARIRLTQADGSVCRHTQAHEAQLVKWGYTVGHVETDRGSFIEIEATVFVLGTEEEPIDVSTVEALALSVKTCIDKKALWTYSTIFKLPSGKIASSVPALAALLHASALVAKPVTNRRNRTSDLNEALALLGIEV